MRLIPFNGRTIVAFAGLLIAAIPAAGYYHFLHYVDGPAGRAAIPEKFDLNALVDGTVYFHVSSASPRLAANDSYEGLVSQIRQALAVWNSVPTSSLRVAYAGTSDAPSLSRSPGGEIIFAELPPGVIGFGGPVTPLGDPKGGFVPIIRSQVILSNDLTQGSRPRPTFSEVFFTSLVHEIGHALGLQHTLTGAVMSTDVTRAATRALPLGADDIAGLSVLYPSPDFSQLNGALAGRVTTQTGAAVHMASVVAVGPNEQVVSALTAPGRDTSDQRRGTAMSGNRAPGKYPTSTVHETGEPQGLCDRLRIQTGLVLHVKDAPRDGLEESIRQTSQQGGRACLA